MQSKRKTNRRIILLTGFLILVLFGLLVIFSNLGSIVKRSIVRYGPQATQTSVYLKSAKISIFTGRAKLEGLTVANPEGFTTPYIATVEHIWMQLDRRSIFSDQIHIEYLELMNPSIVYEQGEKQLNIDVFLTQIAQAVAQESGSLEKYKGTRIQVNRLVVRGAELSVILPGGTVARIPLPDFKLQNLAGENTPILLTQKIFMEFSKEATAPEIQRTIEKALNNIGIKIPESIQKEISARIGKNLLGR